MSLNEIRTSKALRLVLSLAAFGLVIGTGIAGVRARRVVWHSTMILPGSVKDTSASQAQRMQRIADFESELITITPHGFEPDEITRPQGRVLLMVDNRTDLATTSLRLSREAGFGIKEIRVPREDPNWSEAVDLLPGPHLLTESDHPDWVCRIIITPR